MDAETRDLLQRIRDSGVGAYARTASELLAGDLTWSADEVAQFVDGFVNDPYLTRTEREERGA